MLVLLGIVGVSTADTFLTRSNLLTILTSASVIGVITVGVTMVIIGGGIDLSVGKVMALASVWSTTVAPTSRERWTIWSSGAEPGCGTATRQRPTGRLR